MKELYCWIILGGTILWYHFIFGRKNSFKQYDQYIFFY